jgi:hypothetical protein
MATPAMILLVSWLAEPERSRLLATIKNQPSVLKRFDLNYVQGKYPKTFFEDGTYKYKRQ